MSMWSTEAVTGLLDEGPVRLKMKFTDGELRQYTRHTETADTCDCKGGIKSCGFIDIDEWETRLKRMDKDGRIAVWDIGNAFFTNILAEDIDKIIGHNQDVERSCCSSKEK